MSQAEVKVGYVLKCYPRFSETFVVREVIARERAGERIAIASLRTPRDPRFHALLAHVEAPVEWIPTGERSLSRSWEAIGAVQTARLAAGRGPIPGSALRALFDEEPDVAAQAMLVARWAMEQEVGHLHAHFASVAGRTARLAAGLVGLTWSVTAHAKDIFQEDNDPRRQAQVLGEADRVVGVSDMTTDWISSLVPGARVTRIYNGLDLHELTWQAPATRPTRRIVGVGRLVAKKGWPDFLDAVARLRAAGHDVTADIAGTGVLEDELRALAHSLGLGDVVTFHGPMPQHEVVELVRSATVFAAPCIVAPDGDRDGLPTVLLESLALGTPVVATPVTGIPEAVTHDETGFIVPERDPQALAEALARLLDDADLRLRLSRAGRAHVEARFDVTDQAVALRAVTRDLAGALDRAHEGGLDVAPAEAVA